jgi:hypothetical protein
MASKLINKLANNSRKILLIEVFSIIIFCILIAVHVGTGIGGDWLGFTIATKAQYALHSYVIEQPLSGSIYPLLYPPLAALYIHFFSLHGQLAVLLADGIEITGLFFWFGVYGLIIAISVQSNITGGTVLSNFVGEPGEAIAIGVAGIISYLLRDHDNKTGFAIALFLTILEPLLHPLGILFAVIAILTSGNVSFLKRAILIIVNIVIGLVLYLSFAHYLHGLSTGLILPIGYELSFGVMLLITLLLAGYIPFLCFLGIIFLLFHHLVIGSLLFSGDLFLFSLFLIEKKPLVFLLGVFLAFALGWDFVADALHLRAFLFPSLRFETVALAYVLANKDFIVLYHKDSHIFTKHYRPVYLAISLLVLFIAFLAFVPTKKDPVNVSNLPSGTILVYSPGNNNLTKNLLSELVTGAVFIEPQAGVSNYTNINVSYLTSFNTFYNYAKAIGVRWIAWNKKLKVKMNHDTEFKIFHVTYYAKFLTNSCLGTLRWVKFGQIVKCRPNEPIGAVVSKWTQSNCAKKLISFTTITNKVFKVLIYTALAHRSCYIKFS